MKIFVACLIIATLLMMPALAADSAQNTTDDFYDIENSTENTFEGEQEEFIIPPESLTTVYLDSSLTRAINGATNTIKQGVTNVLGDHTPKTFAVSDEPDWNSSTWVKETLTYTINRTSCIVTVYNGSEENLTVPAITTIDGVNYSTVLNGSVFYNRTALKNVTFESGVSIISGFNMFNQSAVSYVDGSGITIENNTQYMFRTIGSDPLTVKNFSLLRPAYMFYMCGASSITCENINLLQNANTTYNMFYSCQNLTSIDISGINFNTIRSAKNMFGQCIKLEEINIESDIISCDTSSMFSNCVCLKTVSHKNISSTMSDSMFKNCYNLTSIDMSKIDISNVSDADWMFDSCRNLTFINLSSANTSRLERVDHMFGGTTHDIDISGWDTSNFLYTGNMFNGSKGNITLPDDFISSNRLAGFQNIFSNTSTKTINLRSNISGFGSNVEYPLYRISATNLTLELINRNTAPADIKMIVFHNIPNSAPIYIDVSKTNFSNINTSFSFPTRNNNSIRIVLPENGANGSVVVGDGFWLHKNNTSESFISTNILQSDGIMTTAYNISYVLSGGTLNGTATSHYGFSYGTELPTASKEYHTFTGWHKKSDLSDPPIYEINNTTIGDHYLYASYLRTTFFVTINQPSVGGFVSTDVSVANTSDRVNVSANVDDGYEFVSWSVQTDAGVPVSVSGGPSGYFEMPDANVTVSAVLQKKAYNVVIDDVTEGSVYSNVSTATYGDTVRIVASPVAGYNFESWTVTTDGGQTVSVTGSDNATFSMPADNVTVRGNFVAGLFVSTVVQTTGGSAVVTPATAVPGTTISIISQPDSGYLNGGYNVRSEAGYEILVTNGTYSMPASNVFVQTNFVPISATFTTLPGTTFTPNSIVLNYTTNARIDDNPTIVWQASDDGFETIGENGTVSGGNGSIVFSTNKTGNMTVRMRPDVGSEWVSIDISISSEVVISICDGVDGSRISTGTPYTSIPGLVTPQGALVNSILNNSTLTITTSNGTTRMTSWMTSINAAAGENITFSYAGSSDSFWDNISWTLTVPTNREMNISLPRKTDGFAGTVLYYTDGGIGIPGLQVSVFDSSYQSLGNITTYAGGQAVFSSESLAAVYFNVNVSGYDENTKVVGIPSSDSVYLAKTRDITIKVLDSMGGEFVSAFTTYLGPDQIMKSTDNGTVSYSGVIDGTYDVMISASGFNQVTRPITVSEFETSFVLQVSQSNTTTYQSPNNVRLIYTDVFGKKIRNLTITVSENNTTIYTGQTGSDGAVALTMNQTKLYTIRAFDITGKEVNSLALWPQYSEYSIIVKSSDEIGSETGLNNVSWKTNTESVNATTTSLNILMKNENTDQNVSYVATLTLGNSTKNFTTGTINANTTANTTFYLPNANDSYLLTISFTDEHNVQKTVTTTIRTDYNELKSKYSLPGFTEQWHYDALCVLIILVTAFLFSQQTKHIGGLLIPLEFAGLYAIGWMRFSAFAMCLCVAGAIMALIMFVEKMDRD